MANALYNTFKGDSMTGAIALSADSITNKTIYVILVSASYTQNIDTDTRYRDVSAHEVNITGPVAVGYFAGGQCMSASNVFAVDTTNDRATWASANITWTSSTITARGAVILKMRTNGLNKDLDNLIGYVDFGSNQSSSNGSFTIQWNAIGVLSLT